MSEKINIKTNKNGEYLTLPTVVLRGLVIFPNNIVHFDVGREKSVNAVNDAMDNDRMVFLVPQTQFDVEDPIDKDINKIGVVAEVKQVLKHQDGYIKVMVEAKYRAKIVDIATHGKFVSTIIKPLPIKKIPADEITYSQAMVRSIKAEFEKYLAVAPKMSRDIISRIFITEDANRICELISANIMLKTENKIDVLNENSVIKRLSYVYDFLKNETEVMKLEAEIKSRTHEEMDRGQKEYYLRQQMKTIADELGDGEDLIKESDEYRQKIKSFNLAKDVEDKLLKEVSRLEKMQGAAQEAAVIRTYLDTCLSIPWNATTEDQLNVSKAENILNKDHYGMKKVKDKVLEILSVRQLSENTKGQIICLVGPPGVGKTSIASSIAKCLNRNFVRISLGGVRDESEIRGHRRTYVGAMPGKIINGMIQAKSNNPVFLLDEIDKLTGDFRGDPASALLEVLDSEQNHSFNDHYIDLPVDLSNVFFIATANDRSTIPGPLLDRMDIIELPSYTREEKFNIAKKHLIPKQLEKNGMKQYVKFADSAIYEVIDCYTREAGVRTLERTIVTLLRKSAKIIAQKDAQTVNINKKTVIDMLGYEIFKPDNIDLSDKIGVANGLAWTSVGGEMLPIEVAIIPNGNGKIQITGNLGKVMEESCRIALSYIKANYEKYNITYDFSKIDIHVHAPEGAVPKDGPSAGVTMATALLSALTKRSVKGDVAMTGEITLQGRVLPIGGLREKRMAAYREGMKTVIIPFDNHPNLQDVDNVVKEKIKFVPVKNIDQAINVNLNQVNL